MNHTINRIWIVLLMGTFLLSSCSSDEDTPVEVPVVIPEISALSDSTFMPGDTLGVAGAKFATPVSSNRVVFNNSEAAVVPFLATADSLAVIVPINANTGGLYVTSKGVASNKINVLVERGVGDVWVMGGSGNYEFTVPVPTGSEKYLIVPHSATSSGGSYAYDVTPNNLPLSAPQAEALLSLSPGTTDFAFDFATAAREEAIEYLKTHEPREREPDREALTSADVAAAPAARDFLVLTCTGCSVALPSSFATVSAELRYDGTRVLIYSDSNQPAGSFTQSDYDAFGADFDNSIYPTNTNFFGPPTDIDTNSKIIILFTPRVNDLTPDGTAVNGFISGFVLINDLAPGVFPPGTTNGGEIFYSMVPDPNGETGNTFPKTVVESVVPGTLAHEFEHMISNGYRLVVLGQGTDPRYIQQTWLEEGMAHMAEDLNNMDGQNILRSNLYLGTPYATSLLGNAELRPYAADTLEQRGGIYLFLRYLGDQFGDEIFKTIVQTPVIGEASIANVTGTGFQVSVADYLATLYLSNRGITSNPKYNFSSFNFQNTFGNLNLDSRSAGAGGFSGAVRSATGRFHLISGTQAATLKFGVTSASNAVVRCVVVRTE